MSSRDEKTISELFSDIEDNKCVLPDFQREFVWDDTRQKKLLASTLVNLSIGSLLFIEGSKDDFSVRQLGYTQNDTDYNQVINSNCSFLLDGQQRLTCLWSFFSDIFADYNSKGNIYKNWRTTYDKLFTGLSKRWVISLKPSSSISDLFGYEHLNFEQDISTLEPDDVIDYISSKKILVKNYKFWFHPGYLNTNKKDLSLTQAKRDQSLIDEAAQECVVPFYTLSKSKLYLQIIDKIAKNRSREIEDELDNISDIEQLKEKCKELFCKIDPNNEEQIEITDDIDDLREKTREYLADLRSSWASNIKTFFSSILKNRIYFLRLEKKEIGRAIAIFTAINEGGQKLSTFDLVVAKAAKDPQKKYNSLIQRIRESVKEKINLSKSKLDSLGTSDWELDWMGCIDDENNISPIFKDNFLNVLSGFSHGNYLEDKKNFPNNLSLECFKAGMQLKLDSSQISKNYDITMRAITRAYAFLQFRCGIVAISDLSYKLMLVPLAFCLIDDRCWKDKDVLDKLEFWYWTSIFSGRYRDAQNQKSLEDCIFLFKHLVLNNNLSKDDIDSLNKRKDAIFTSTTYCDLDTLTRIDKNSKVPTAIHNAILQYVLSNNPIDFLPCDDYEQHRLTAWEIARCINSDYQVCLHKKNNQTVNASIKLQDHHIYPLGAAKSLNSSTKELRANKDHPLNSPLNRTYISNIANGIISSMQPDQYFSGVDSKALSDHLASDFITAQRAQSQSDIDFYIELLKQRFNTLKLKLTTELEQLWKL